MGNCCFGFFKPPPSHTPVDKLLSNLQTMKSEGRSTAYAVFQTGALNPTHRGHVEMLATARTAMEAKGQAVVAGWLGPTGDWYVLRKTKQLSQKPPRMVFKKEERYEVAKRMVNDSEHRFWLDVDGWDIFVGGLDFKPHMAKVQETLDANEQVKTALRRAGFTRLQVVYVMGDDHYTKVWRSPSNAVVIGRADIDAAAEKKFIDSAEQVESFAYRRAGAAAADLSSTKFKAALVANQFDDAFCSKDVWDYLKARLDAALERCPQDPQQ